MTSAPVIVLPTPPPPEVVYPIWWVFATGVGVGMCIAGVIVSIIVVKRKMGTNSSAGGGGGWNQDLTGSMLRDTTTEFSRESPSYSPPHQAVQMVPRENIPQRGMSVSCVSFVDPEESQENPLQTQSSWVVPQTTACSPITNESFCRKMSGSPRVGGGRRRTIINRGWTKGKLLGVGGFGKVYSCVCADAALMAVKILDLSTLADDSKAQAIIREVELLSKLTHENIVDYYDSKIDEENNELQLFMEMVNGGSLGQFVRDCSEQLTEAVVAKYTAQILEGVAYLHTNNVVHRDLKGDNILMSADGTMKISDFGTSKNINPVGRVGVPEASFSNSQIQGTPLWSAPETFDGTYTTESDVWSVGCVVCEMLTKKPPWPLFETVWAAITTIGKCSTYPELMPREPEVTSQCEDFLKCCLNPVAEDRTPASELKRHHWIEKHISPDIPAESSESEVEPPTAIPQLLRKISEINTPTHKVGSFRRRRGGPGRLSFARQMAFDSINSINLGEPQVALEKDSQPASSPTQQQPQLRSVVPDSVSTDSSSSDSPTIRKVESSSPSNPKKSLSGGRREEQPVASA
eukprot:TRINITY_DN10717_c0_g2_i1.p1 TRINITY_DN10717_c0_g2~~TRINITY_DN10717_c0_g2_i1.p1  ORF type:complete len:576 (+),score=131.50 TRINITY_DN10717_c0_g2_i1:123-1850(+)